MNWMEPKSLAPCVMIPDIFLGDVRSTWRHTNMYFYHSVKINPPTHTHRSALSRSVYLQPLWLVVGGSGPSISLALFVQPSVVREPGEGLDAPGAEGAGGCDLTIGHQSGLHAHGLWTTWSGWIHCEGETRQSNRGRETGEDERKDTGRQQTNGRQDLVQERECKNTETTWTNGPYVERQPHTDLVDL